MSTRFRRFAMAAGAARAVAAAIGPLTAGPSARRLQAGDVPSLRGLLDVFGRAFEDPETYSGKPPGDAYLESLLRDPTFIALEGCLGGTVAGGLVAYELRKFEQERSEIYLYDLAVLEPYRRQGVATAMIQALRQIAVQRAAHVIFVQADYGDDAAVALYTKLGTREDVMHFDIAPGTRSG